MLSADHEARLSLALLFCGEDDFEEWDNDGGGRGGGATVAAADVALRGSNATENRKQCYYSTHLDGWNLILALPLDAPQHGKKLILAMILQYSSRLPTSLRLSSGFRLLE